MTDEEYTKKVDDDSYTEFVYDCAGYGISHWTHWRPKANLMTLTDDIGDLQYERLSQAQEYYTAQG